MAHDVMNNINDSTYIFHLEKKNRCKKNSYKSQAGTESRN